VPIFDISSNTPSPNAKLAMNNDIVKPIPHSQLAQRFCPATPAGVARRTRPTGGKTYSMGFRGTNPAPRRD
jgi:hypothetical protein